MSFCIPGSAGRVGNEYSSSLWTSGRAGVAVRSQAELGNENKVSQAVPGSLFDIDSKRVLLFGRSNHQFVLHFVDARFQSNHGSSQLLGVVAAHLATKNGGIATGKDL